VLSNGCCVSLAIHHSHVKTVPNTRCAGYITFKESFYPYNPANFGSDGISMVRHIRAPGSRASDATSPIYFAEPSNQPSALPCRSRHTTATQP
jgi:hypothetical protein